MKELKSSIAILVLFLMLVFGIANIDEFQSSVFDFNPEFFILMAAAVFSGVIVSGALIQMGVKLNNYAFVSFWIIVYVVVWTTYLEENRAIEVQLIQLLLVSISAGLSYDVSKRLAQLDQALKGLSSNAYPNRAWEIDEAQQLIFSEFTRSRRYHHPLVLLVFEARFQGGGGALKQYEALQRDIINRFAVAKISQILSEYLRNTDFILRDKDGKFVVLCPETHLNNISIVAERIAEVTKEDLGVDIRWGGAVFPDEALTFEELLQTARRRIGQPSSVSEKPAKQ